ncbi:hypothetical protein Tco_1491427 [Tanacetum coccineum]
MEDPIHDSTQDSQVISIPIHTCHKINQSQEETKWTDTWLMMILFSLPCDSSLNMKLFKSTVLIPKTKYVRRITKEQACPDKPLRLPLVTRTKLLLKCHEGTGVTPGVPDVPIYGSDEEKISWKFSDEEDDDDEANIGKDEDDDDQDDDEQTKSDNDSNEESNEESDEEVQGANTEEEEIDEEATHEEDKANELYKDVNVNLEGRDTVMTDAPLPNVQATQEIEDTHVILTALINPEGIDSIFTLNTKATSLVDVLVTTIARFKQTNQFAEAVSSIPGIVDAYLANKMHEAVKTAVQEANATAKGLWKNPILQEFYTWMLLKIKPVDETLRLLVQFVSGRRFPVNNCAMSIGYPLDFSAFIMNRLKVDTLTPELLAGPTFEPMKGTCKSLVELEYFFEEVYKETKDSTG